jgi:Cu/Ag efflux protein CusF
MKSRSLSIVAVALLATATVCCQTGSDNSQADPQSEAFDGAGRLTKISPNAKHVTILHGDIDGLMEGMEMSFPLGDSVRLGAISIGDSIQFRVRVVNEGGFFIEIMDVVGE